ncbi:MAG: CDP-alcohol phosphatidyltransferase family protein [Candidatus Staskawiczbacteria bacterium]|nr:CDP-alcohol phosphatidyltransferase family protein [Candidatus Staskawiczbacteria bacterium]
MRNYFDNLGATLQKISLWKDNVLLSLIRPWWNKKITPNHVTYVRIVIGIVLLILLFGFGIDNKILILSLFCLGGITDLIDGPIARGFNMVTNFGATLDVTADRFLIVPIAVYSLWATQKPLLLVLFLTEILNAAVVTYYKKKIPHIESNIFGKTKIFLMVIVFIIILIIWPSTTLPAFLVYTLWVSVLFSLLSVTAWMLELKDKGHFKKSTSK